MKVFDGLSRTDYQDLLRALGRLLDERGLQNIRIFEHADGLVVQGCPPQSATYESHFFSDADLLTMLQESYRHRGPTA
jgi:hypothetical protein